MPYREPPLGFEVTQDFVMDGVQYLREDVLLDSEAAAFRKLNVLVSSRILLPVPDDIHLRRTDFYGFGDTPRKNPTPTYYSPVEVQALLNV